MFEGDNLVKEWIKGMWLMCYFDVFVGEEKVVFEVVYGVCVVKVYLKNVVG